MRPSRVVCWLFASLTLISLAPSAIAQQDQVFETGLNPYRTYQSGNIDSINVLNRGLNVDIPLISYPQRGGKLNLDFDLHYINQGNWYNCTPGTNCSGYYGSGQALINGFGVIPKNWPSYWGTTCQSTGDQYGDWTCQGSATMSDGSVHSMLPVTVSNWESEDTSGLQMGGVFALGGGNAPPFLIDANGTRYSQPYAPSYFPGPVGGESYYTYVPTLVEDVNGNEISYSQTAGWTDTMGRTIPLPMSVSTSICPQQSPLLAPVAAYTWSLPGVSGGTGTYTLTFCYVYVPVTVNWDAQILHESEEELQTVILPNGTSWTFQYTSDGHGDLSQITFPTGGTLSYTWSTDNPLCNSYYYSNARAVVTRTLNPNDGVSPAATWTYGGSLVVPVVTDPASNDTVHTFSSLVTNACPYYETETQYYQGSHSSGTLLKTVNTKYQALWSSSIYTTGLGQPSQTTSLWANGQENETSYTYDSALNFHAADYVSSTEFSTHMGGTYPPASYGLLETKKDYDYGNGAPGSLLRTTTTTYEALSNSNYLTNNMLALPASVAITGSGPGSTTTYAFDQTTPVSSGITTMHSSNPPGGTYRGNPTTVSRYLNTTGTYLNTTSTFFDTGMVHVVTDPKTNPTATYLYSPTYVGAYVTSVTNAANQTTTYAYDFNTGLLTSTTDPNNQTTSSTYDDMLRTTEINYPDGGVTTFTYQTAYQTEITEKMDTSGDNRISFIWVDGVGREGRVAVTNGETLGYDETVDICYNGLGQISFQGYPFQDGGWSAPRSCSIAGDSFTYDALSRNTKVSHFDGSAISTSYTGNAATVTDEQSKTRESFVDGLGRLEEVIENPGGLNYVTNYTHDALDDLTGVTQVSSHSRTFTYDSLSRLTSAANPESGTVSYTYDSDGNVTGRTDARSITTTYSYDALNRITGKAYSDGSEVVSFGYDVNNAWGASLTNTVGRLAWEDVNYPASGSSQYATWSTFSYDPLGRPLSESHCLPSPIVSCQSLWTISGTRNLLGDLTSLSNGAGVTFSYSYNAAGRPITTTSSLVDTQHPATLVSGVHYNAASSITAAALGNGLMETSAYNGRLQPCRLNLNSSGTALSSCTAAVPSGNVLDLNVGLNYGSGDNGNVMSFSAVGAQTFSRSYTYDALNRIYTMSAPGDQCTGLQWTIDAWGNRTNQTATGGTCDAFSQPVGTNNRFSNSSYQYDAAGNMLNDGVHAYAYDAENRISSVDSGSTA